MNTPVSALIYGAAGFPAMPGAHEGICRTCGLVAAGMPFANWVRDTFTDHDKLRPGEIICHACQFCFTDRNEDLTRRTGKDKPQRMRNYSHFVVRGEWTPLSKGDKTRMWELLMQQPEVAVIASSGQKHIIFRARPGWWQFEEFTLRPFPADLARALALVEALYRGGFSKGDIETGRYPQHRILKFGLREWSAIETQLKPMRGMPALMLALFLAQKEEDDESGDSGQPTLAGMARDPRRLQEEVRP